MKQKRIRITLVVLEVFVATSCRRRRHRSADRSVQPRLHGLQSSPFVDYTIPALSLMVMVVGGDSWVGARSAADPRSRVIAHDLKGVFS
jgi:hypothetical protein